MSAPGVALDATGSVSSTELVDFSVGNPPAFGAVASPLISEAFSSSASGWHSDGRRLFLSSRSSMNDCAPNSQHLALGRSLTRPVFVRWRQFPSPGGCQVRGPLQRPGSLRPGSPSLRQAHTLQQRAESRVTMQVSETRKGVKPGQ
jgi:hypothetical protein